MAGAGAGSLSHSQQLMGQSGGSMGTPRAGVKNQIEEIVQKLQDHDEMLSRIDASMEKNANLADDSLKAVQASLKASLASLRDEMNRKLQAMTIEIAQLQKQMNVQRGEQNILAQQSKDTTKRLEVVAGHVTDLAAELHGDEAHVAVAGGATY
jgi:chromosome segregation ATPase